MKGMSRGKISALLPDTRSGTDRTAVPHPARSKLLVTSVGSLAAIFGASSELLCGIVLEGAHDVRGEADAVLAALVEERGVLLAFSAGTCLGWLWLASPLGVASSEDEGEANNCLDHGLHCTECMAYARGS